jgi:hypothetical protein
VVAVVRRISVILGPAIVVSFRDAADDGPLLNPTNAQQVDLLLVRAPAKAVVEQHKGSEERRAGNSLEVILVDVVNGDRQIGIRLVLPDVSGRTCERKPAFAPTLGFREARAAGAVVTAEEVDVGACKTRPCTPDVG